MRSTFRSPGELDALARLREVRKVLAAWPCTLLYLSVVRDQSLGHARAAVSL
jgi:hypothetical protein